MGEPLVPSTDYDVWKRLLADAKVRDGRLHDARHTAATVLLILGVPERVVMQIMGRSSAGKWPRTLRRAARRAVRSLVETANVEGPHRKRWGPSTYCPVRAMAEDTRFELVR
ncbi:hypothetical protein ACFRCW_03385, partial [Streptomyces sp. NPDC056653]